MYLAVSEGWVCIPQHLCGNQRTSFEESVLAFHLYMASRDCTQMVLIPKNGGKRLATQIIMPKLIKVSFLFVYKGCLPQRQGLRDQHWMCGRQGFDSSGVEGFQIGDLVHKIGRVTGVKHMHNNLVLMTS